MLGKEQNKNKPAKCAPKRTDPRNRESKSPENDLQLQVVGLERFNRQWAKGGPAAGYAPGGAAHSRYCFRARRLTR